MISFHNEGGIMYRFIFLLFLSFQTNAADFVHPYPSFSEGEKLYTFPDFLNAHYYISYDSENKSASIKAEISFKTEEEGYPLFDLKENPTRVELDGKEIETPLVDSPKKETKFRVMNQLTSIGVHTLRVEVPLKFLLRYTDKGVDSAFWLADLDDRSFLENYIPSSFENDSVEMIFDVSFKISADQQIFANGEIERTGDRDFRITFPKEYTSSSVYYHTTPLGSFNERRFEIKSKVSGKVIPVIVYSKTISNFNSYEESIRQTMDELEADYGPYLHSSFIVYDADLSRWGLGGMEYCGATVTNLWAVQHELFHSFFGRGVMAANGNSGWIDEALASWRDGGYFSNQNMRERRALVLDFPYVKKTNRLAYSYGKNFISFLDGNTKMPIEMKLFMKSLYQKKSWTPITTEDLIVELDLFSGNSYQQLFDEYVYGNKSTLDASELWIEPNSSEHSIHRKISGEDLYKIL
ncbi:MAG: hypothetical protein CL678_16525 [Bdellovibrionaceae bacterium]|nr:hypothetical protein [Pseudobdellovibrionaceae bacterium]